MINMNLNLSKVGFEFFFICYWDKFNFSIDVRKNLAEKSFKIIGKKIKNRRMADFHDIMNSRLPEDFE